jgi:hypothetical protein
MPALLLTTTAAAVAALSSPALATTTTATATASSAPVTFPLTSPSVAWTVSVTNASSPPITVTASVPGQITLDLHAAGVIPEPYVDLNVDALKWITNSSSVYTATFTLPPALLSLPTVELVAEGLDTFASVVLNGVPLFSSDNAFVTTRLHVQGPASPFPPGLLRPGPDNNTLTVSLASPVLGALAAKDSCASEAPFYCPNNSLTIDGLPAVNYVRKQPSSFGWDFAPAFAPSGIWRPLSLVGYATAVVVEATVTTELVGGASATVPTPDSTWTLNVTAFLRSAGLPAPAGTLELSFPGLPGSPVVASVPVQVLVAGDNAVVLPPFNLTNVSAWWPNGMGAQPRYAAQLTFTSSAPAPAAETSTFPFPVAFRTTALRQPATGEADGGALFFFEVNTVPVYVKGSNLVPYDAFDARVTPERIGALLDSFVEANFNVARIWGGGIFPSTAFYDAADARGLLVWQEAMFACAAYPVGASFLSSVATEVAQNTRRAQKYSVLAWSGNNEDEWIEAKYNTTDAVYYGALDFGVVLDAFGTVDPARPRLSSSPSNGNETAESPSSPNPNSPVRGDMHIYMYASDAWDADAFPRPRFASEFGWQSYSSFPSMAALVSPQFWFYWSDVMANRDHHPSQPQWLILYKNVGENWRIPEPQPPNQTFVDMPKEAAVGGARAPQASARRAAPRDPWARHVRLSGRAARLAREARAANSTRLRPVRNADGTLDLPRDALGWLHLAALWMGEEGTDEEGLRRWLRDADEAAARGEPGGLLLPALSNVTVFADTLWMTQVAQAYAVKTEAEFYRRISQEGCADAPDSPLPRDSLCTSGTLYWMANDPWPAATKGSVEYNGRWKVLHGYASRVYSPFLVSAFSQVSPKGLAPADRAFTLSVSSQQAPALRAAGAGADIPDGCVVLTSWSWSQGLVGSLNVPFSLAGGWNTTTLLSPNTTTLAQVLEGTAPGGGPCVANISDCVLTVAAYNGSCSSSKGEGAYPLLDDNFLFLGPFTNVTTMRDPRLTITDVEAAPDLGPLAYRVSYAAAGPLPAALVWLQSQYTGHFDDSNGRVLTAPSATAVFRLDPSESGGGTITPGQLAASLSIWSLFDVSAEYGG